MMVVQDKPKLHSEPAPSIPAVRLTHHGNFFLYSLFFQPTPHCWSRVVNRLTGTAKLSFGRSLVELIISHFQNPKQLTKSVITAPTCSLSMMKEFI